MSKQSSTSINTTAQNDSALVLESLTKYYGPIKGIENVSFKVQQGEIHGFLGPNGAGKTTTIRILVGLMGSTEGYGKVFGHPAGSMAARKLIGYLPSDFGLPKHYSVRQYLNYLESIRGKAPYRRELVERMQLDENRRTAELSKGNRQKVSIVQALMHEPKILIADEPTSGLDPLMQAEFNKYLKSYVDRGGTVFVSSHILSDVQDICSKVTIIREGHIVSSGDIDNLLASMPRKIMVSLSEGISIDNIADQLDAEVGPVELDKFPLYVEGSSKEIASKLISIDGIDDFSIPEPSLEAYFHQIYAGDERELQVEE